MGLVLRPVPRNLAKGGVFALTGAPEFFIKCGFHLTARENFPTKIAHDCLNCALYSRCQEKTVSIRIRPRRVRKVEAAEPVAVLAWKKQWLVVSG